MNKLINFLKENWFLVLFFIIGAVLRFYIAYTTEGASFDIESFRIQGETVLAGKNIYQTIDRFPYPPSWLLVAKHAVLLSQMISLPFHFIVKIPTILAGLALSVLVYVLAATSSHLRRRLIFLLFIFNPVEIVIGAGHGQFDALPIFSLVLSLYLLEKSRRWQFLVLAGFSLGVAVSLKLYPIILLPAVLLSVRHDIRQKAAMALLAIMPTFLLSIPFLLHSWPEFYHDVLSYHGTTDFGLSFLGKVYLPSFWTDAPLRDFVFFTLVRYLFFAVVLIVSWIHRRKSLLYTALVVFVTFYVFAPGLSAQYFYWVLPFLTLFNPFGLVVFSLLAVPSLIGFYLTYFPTALPFQSLFARVLVNVQTTPEQLHKEAALALWMFCLFFLFRDFLKRLFIFLFKLISVAVQTVMHRVISSTRLFIFLFKLISVAVQTVVHRMINFTRAQEGIVIAALFFITGLITLPSYSITTDEPSLYNAGYETLNYLLERRQISRFPYGPALTVFSALFHKFLYREWSLIPPDIALRIPVVVMASVGVWLVYAFAYHIKDRWAGRLAAITLALWPNYFGFAHNNPKDIAVTVLMAITVYLFWRAKETSKGLDWILAGVSWGLALNIKINAILLIPVIMFWLVSSERDQIERLLREWGVYVMVTMTVLTFFLSWPFLWQNTIENLKFIVSWWGQLTDQKNLYLGRIYSASGTPWHYPYVYLAIQTPIIYLTLLILSLYIMIRSNKSSVYLLLWIWILVPIVKYLFFHIPIYDGMRHFFEVVIPISLIVGITASEIIATLAKRGLRKLALTSIIAYLLLLIWTNVSYHPYQNLFFNSLVGNTKRAAMMFSLDEWDYSAKATAAWIAQHVPLGARIYANQMPLVAYHLHSPEQGYYLWFGTSTRSDLGIMGSPFSADYVFLANDPAGYTDLEQEFIKGHTPSDTVIFRGVPLVQIYIQS